jgi:hypothetical protein
MSEVAKTLRDSNLDVWKQAKAITKATDECETN